eukprot:SAG31_NODE_20356_length_577_cov_0.539749_1_plen_85_part_10
MTRGYLVSLLVHVSLIVFILLVVLLAYKYTTRSIDRRKLVLRNEVCEIVQIATKQPNFMEENADQQKGFGTTIEYAQGVISALFE